MFFFVGSQKKEAILALPGVFSSILEEFLLFLNVKSELDIFVSVVVSKFLCEILENTQIWERKKDPF